MNFNTSEKCVCGVFLVSLCLQLSRVDILLIGGIMFGMSASLLTAVLLSWCKSTSGLLILNEYKLGSGLGLKQNVSVSCFCSGSPNLFTN